MGTTHKVLLHTKMWRLSWGKAIVSSSCVLIIHFLFFTEHHYYLNDCQIMVIESWVSGKYFLLYKMNEMSLLHQGKQIVFVTNDKIWDFKKKLEFWKTCIFHHELDSVPTLKDFYDDSDGDINDCDFWLLCNEMCQHLEDLHLTQWRTNCFQMTNGWCYKIKHG